MLPKVGIGRRCGAIQANVDRYRALISDELYEEIRSLAAELRGVKICHVNSTAVGGGVAELLARYVPMLQALGVAADWRLIHGEPEFFAITKAFHNALQGAHYDLGKPDLFLLPELASKRVAIIAPAIDPLATKNMDLPEDLCRRAIQDSGVDPTRPLLVQVSRFDPWKDPLGVVRAYRLVKQEIPGVQLALIGAMAGDDPEGWEILDRVEEQAANDPDLFVFTNLAGVGSMEVNVFQRGCDVVIQKSLREGFGLVVSEAFWKEKPVVAGNAGGIPMQFPEEYRKNLIGSVEACAERVIHLLGRPGERGAFGRAGREHVRQHYLLPRLVRDELTLIKQVVQNT